MSNTSIWVIGVLGFTVKPKMWGYIEVILGSNKKDKYAKNIDIILFQKKRRKMKKKTRPLEMPTR